MKAAQETPLAERVRRFICENNLLSGRRELVVAVSGGADSVCLLHLLVGLRDELGVSLHVAHLDHRLRKDASTADAAYAAGLARRLRLPATIESAEVKAYQRREHLSLEEAAREVRYAFLARVARATGADGVIVGHTRDDHVETILLHLIRGSGTRGLRGLQPLSEWPSAEGDMTIIRPLLEVSREETAAYCRSHRLAPRVDASNLSLSPLRNRIRLELLPLLQRYNPGINEVLLRTARIAADELEFLDGEVSRRWKEVAESRPDAIVLRKEKLRELPPALQRHLLRRAIAEVAGDLKDIEARHIEEMRAALDKPAGKIITLPYGLSLVIEYDRCLLVTEKAARSPLPPLEAEWPLAVPGETCLPGWQVRAEVIEREEMSAEDDPFTACFDFTRTGDSLVLRRRQTGDRFQPLGMDQPKKLNQFMIDARIPRAWRGSVPLVCREGQIIWVAGWRIDERYKVTADTRQVLFLKLERVL